MAASPCEKHHPQEALVGVCASCLRERLATSIGSLGNNRGGGGGGRGGEGEPAASNESFGCSIILSQGIGNNGSPNTLRERDKRTLSYYLENIHGVSSNCKVHQASHRKAISSDAIYCQGNSSSYTAHHYVGQGAKEYPSITKEAPTLSTHVLTKGRPLSWLSAFFSKREEKQKQKAHSGECSIAPWRDCSQYHEESYDHLPLSSDAPSWEQLSPWARKPTRSPLLLSQSARSPLKLPPLLSPAHSTRSPPLMVTAPLSFQSTRSPLKLPPLHGSPRTPLKLSPLLSYPRSPLKLFSSKPTIACDGKAQVEVDQRSEHGISSVQAAKRRDIWFGILMRNKWVVRFKRHFARRSKRQEDMESVRTSSARESDFCRHGHNHYLVQGRHGQNWSMEKNQRPSRGGREAEQRSASGRDYAGWESYFTNSFNGLQVRHRYHSADSAELLRFYLTPVRTTCKVRSHHYY